MNINIKATNIELTDALRDYTIKRVEYLSKFIEGSAENAVAAVEIGKTTNHHHAGDIFRAEINLRLNGKTFRSVAEKDDLYVAITEMREEVLREITGKRGKDRTLLKRGGHALKAALRGIGGFFKKRK